MSEPELTDEQVVEGVTWCESDGRKRSIVPTNHLAYPKMPKEGRCIHGLHEPVIEKRTGPADRRKEQTEG